MMVSRWNVVAAGRLVVVTVVAGCAARVVGSVHVVAVTATADI